MDLSLYNIQMSTLPPDRQKGQTKHYCNIRLEINGYLSWYLKEKNDLPYKLRFFPGLLGGSRFCSQLRDTSTGKF